MEHSLTPTQLFEVSPRSAELDDIVNRLLYGVEEEGLFPDMDSNNRVVVPSVSVCLSPSQEASVLQLDPLLNDGNYGIDLYCSVRSLC